MNEVLRTNASEYPAPPVPGSQAGRRALRALLRHKDMLAALEVIHAEMGDVFRLPLPGFSPVVLVGPEANRFVTVTGRDDLRWRFEGDPVTRLLKQGLLVTDGPFHDDLRHRMNPALHKQMLAGYIEKMWRNTDRILDSWTNRSAPDMLVEMRRIALLILTDTLFRIDLYPQLHRLWPTILRTLAYISPGLWLLWPGIPRPGYARALREMDRFLYEIIAARRALPGAPDDLLGLLAASPDMSADLIRDQLLTMLIAGHDTSTALLAWALYLLGSHPQAMWQAREEVDAVLGTAREAPSLEQLNRLDFLEKVINETLRLYPPIHIGNRIAARDLVYQGYGIPIGTRVVYSIYLTHRQEQYWPEPEKFNPQRFSPEQARQRPHYTFVPFGAGPRNCIGFAFAQVEAKVVLARILQTFDLQLAPHSGRIHPHMGATLEPRPGVRMRVQRRI